MSITVSGLAPPFETLTITSEKMIGHSGKPVLIMMDELVNHLKDARAEKVGDTNLAEITVAFFHTLTDVIANSKNSMLIVTLPGTESAYKKESEMLEEYKRMVKELSNREASFTVPIEKSEIYEIIKKRLFEHIDSTLAREVAEQLQRFYVSNSENFPEEVTQTPYYEKIKKSYPFHPSLIDLLYGRISTIGEFQTTRGVLRLLSYVVRSVFNDEGAMSEDIIITPGLVDLNENTIFQELTNKIARGEFQSVIRTDMVNDEGEGKCQKMDSMNKFGACTRIATTIYLFTLIGSTNKTSLGCANKELILASSVEGITHPNDIINDVKKLENTLWFIHNKGGKWYFSVEVNINKVISDETEKVTKSDYEPEIKLRLRKMLENGDFFDVRIWEHDIRGPAKPTLVVAHYDSIRGKEGEVPDMVKEIIDKDGSTFRTKKNLVYVLVVMSNRVPRIIDASRRFLAIKNIKSDLKSKEEMKPYASKIDELLKESDYNLNLTIELCYSLIYYPHRTEIKFVTIQDGYEGASNLPEKILNALLRAGKIISTLLPIYISDKILKDKSELTVGEIYADFEESPSNPLPKSKQVVLNSIFSHLTFGRT